MKYLLIGPGRWGSADNLLGIPVEWHEISGVGAIIELANDQLAAEPSQGTHFFQNITSLGIPYFTINENSSTGEKLDWQSLKNHKEINQTKYLRHVRLEEPFTLKVNGKLSEGVIY